MRNLEEMDTEIRNLRPSGPRKTVGFASNNINIEEEGERSARKVKKTPVVEVVDSSPA